VLQEIRFPQHIPEFEREEFLKMKKNTMVLMLFLAAIAFAAGFSQEAEAKNAEDVFAVSEKESDWIVKSGGEAEGSRGGSLEQNMYWYAVDPENDPAAEGLERGVLIYDGDTEKYFFLPTAEEQTRVENVFFSPDKNRMVLCCSVNRFATGLWVYEAKTLELEKSFWGYSDVFFIDDVRFAFTLIDETTERPEAAGMWGLSAALYDPSADAGYVVLKGATGKENFTVMGPGENENEISISVTSVDSEKDWEDPEKHTDSESTVEIPAAG
jgi:hypothetical protein